jgi:hypothetical protein
LVNLSYEIIVGAFSPKNAFDIDVKAPVNKLRTCSFSLPNRSGKYNSIEIPDALTMKLKGELKFQGVVDSVDKRLKGKDFLVIDGVGLGYKLWDALLMKDYEDVNGKTIIKDAIALTDLTDNNVDPDDEIATTFTRKYFKRPVFKVIEEICKNSAKSTGEIGFDFYVDVEGDVHVFPWNKFTSSVIAKRGVNVERFRVKRLGYPIKNQIWVYGEASKLLPPDEIWTESLDDWEATQGTLSLNSTLQKKGSYCIDCYAGVEGYNTQFHRILPDLCILLGWEEFRFWIRSSFGVPDIRELRLWCPDASNYFKIPDLGDFSTNWVYKTFKLGNEFVYDESENPEGPWHKVGSPSWFKIHAIEWNLHYLQANHSTYVDGLFSFGGRYEGYTEDFSSIAKYGAKPLEPIFIDELTSDAQCLIVAKEEKKRRKDPRRVLEVDVVPANLKLKQGDRMRVIDDKVHQIDEYARTLEVSHVLGSPFKSVLALSTEIPSFAPEFAKIFEELDRLERRGR